MQIKPILSADSWNKFIRKYPGANFLQSSNWGDFQKHLGKKVWKIGIFQSDKLVGCAQFYLEKARRGCYLACPGGPLISFDDSSVLSSLMDYLSQIARDENAWFFRCRPQTEDNSKTRIVFQKAGFISSPMHMSAELTTELDLTKTPDEILAGMRKNTRYLLRKAQKNNLKIIKSNNIGDIDLLYELQLQTKKKHGFVPFDKQFLKKQFEVFLPDNALLFKAYEGSTLSNIAFVIFYNQEAVYHYSASDKSAYKNYASYLLQWEIINEAKKRGCTKYNFWGIAPADRPKHRFWGVRIFKTGFGGKEVAYLHAQDYVFSKKYYLTRTFELLRKKTRKL